MLSLLPSNGIVLRDGTRLAWRWVMGVRILFFSCFLFAGIAAACGGSVTTSGSSGSSATTPGSGGSSATTPGSSGDPGGRGDAGVAQSDASAGSTFDGPCELLAASVDTSCTSDSDCAFAPPGGDTCDPCVSAQTFWCATSAVNAKSAAAYLARIAAVQNQMRDVNANGGFCSASCPVELRPPACLDGHCG
jgi:hypothetical protein